ncbi:MAG: L-threonylcarbamoyladenylate synthase [Elusimicrobiota bacterium]|jgi:L-threonylcarbamoyladenylate synthase
MKTRIVPLATAPEPELLRELAGALQQGRLFVFPTDTVYGLGTTGLIRAAVRRIYDAKGRDAMKPLPVLIHSTDEARRWAEWTPAAEALARRFWPGALTLVLRPTLEGRRLTTSEQPTVAFRVPGHPLLRELIEASGVPWASTSANRSGRPAIADGAQAAAEFDGRADFILDGGRTGGLESTVVDATGSPRVLREGAIPSADILRSA